MGLGRAKAVVLVGSCGPRVTVSGINRLVTCSTFWPTVD